MRRPPSRDFTFTFGPGPISSAVKKLIIANVAVFVIVAVLSASLRLMLTSTFGLVPSAVLKQLFLWQPVTYMFLHGTIGHIFFNMLALWMFGTELERLWGTPAFIRYYFVTGIAAAVTTIVVSLFPFEWAASLFDTTTIGASGAIFGLLLAYGLTFPNRPIYVWFVFPVPAKYLVMIMGGIALLSAVGDAGGGIAHITHLGGLVAGYLMLRGVRLRPADEIKYRYLRWKLDRARKKFGVYSGGKRDTWDRHIH
jgi:membrane associated rhomboid family serine protease